MDTSDTQERWVAYVFALIFVGLAVGIILTGWLYFRAYEDQYRTAVERQLTAIAELKVSDLVRYRTERRGDAAVLFKNPAFSRLVRRFLESPQAAETQELRAWLAKLQSSYAYDRIVLLDRYGVERMSIPEGATPIAALVAQRASEALQSGQLVFQDFYRNEHDQRVYLALVVPVLDADERGLPLGIVAFRIDPERYLYPFIKRWPAPTQSAETLLIRRDGGDALFLNELRFHSDTALTLRIPLASLDVPAVQAALGHEGIVEGTDYRGVPVLAALRAVPDSPWSLVARMDVAEVYAPVRDRWRETVLVVASLLVATAASVRVVGSRQRARYYRERYQAVSALSAKDRRYRKIVERGWDVTAVADASGVVKYVSDSITRMLGYTVQECLNLRPAKLLHPDDVAEARRLARIPGSANRQTIQARVRHKDGHWVWLEVVSTNLLDDPDIVGIVINARDVTERKQAEAIVRRQRDLYDVLSQTNQAIIRCTSREELFPAVCRIAVTHGHFLFAWIGFGDAAGQVRPIVTYGEDAGYVADLHISTDASQASGRGPTGQVLRTGRHVVSNDFLGDPATAPWHDAARRAGVRASAAFPVAERGQLVGAITLYAGEPGFFTDDVQATLNEMARDISFALDNFGREADRQRAEEALRETAAELKEAQRLAQVGSWTWDPNTDTAAWSDEMYRIIGRDPQLSPPPYAQTGTLFAPESWRRLSRAVETAVQTGTPYAMEAEVVRPDGTRRWIISRGEPECDTKGRLIRLHGTIQDITERKRADEALHESQARLAVIIESAMDGIITVDEDEHILVFNAAAEKMFGCRSADVIGHTVEHLLPGRSHIQHCSERRDAHRAMGRFLRMTGRRANGEEFPIEGSVSETQLEGRRLLTVIVRDITEAMRAEDARAQLEAQLRQAQKMEAIGTLAGGIAHDFNNILAAIIGNAELAAQDVDPGHAAMESLNEIRKASRRAKDLVQRILTFSRQQAEPQSVIALRPVVEETVNLLRASLPAGVELAATFEADTPTVLADATQIEQVLLNLCTNAWQALEGQTGRIDVHLDGVTLDAEAAGADVRPGSFARLTVRDTGIGMDAATLERIFEPFFTTKPLNQGTGLGLSVVHGIVKAHGGAIAVSSQPRSGSTFTLYFPAATASEQRIVPQAVATEVHAAAAGQHVLYLDDEEALVFLVTRTLERRGFRVSGYTRAEAALAAVRADPRQFDLAVTDLNMPGMSGLEVARELARLRPDLPVVLTSGYITEELRMQAPQAGVRQLIYKPNTVEDLCMVVQGIARARRQAPQAEESNGTHPPGR